MNAREADRYRDWDAAYVLGALVPAEREEYERHLAGCPACTSAVSELAGMPGILAVVPAQEVLAMAEPVTAEPGMARPGSAPSATRPESRPEDIRRMAAAISKRRFRVRAAAAGVAAAACAASVAATLLISTALLGPGGSNAHAGATSSPSVSAPARTSTLAFAAVVASPLSATGTVAAKPWGTEIEWTCDYGLTPRSYGPSKEYALVLIDSSGSQSRVATWSARPGSTVSPSATTSIPVSRIRSVEIQETATGHTLLRAPVATG